MYDEGKGIPQNEKQAVAWYRRASDQGLAQAQNNPGLMYMTGRGVKTNNSSALKLFQLSAEQGYEQGQFNLGVMYDEGWGVDKNPVQAYVWLSRAAINGGADADARLRNVTKKMTPEQIAAARKMITPK